MHFFRDFGVSAVLESSCISYTLRFCARRFLALTKKLLFLRTPLGGKLTQTKTIIGNSEFPILKTVVSIGTPIRLSAISANRA